MDDVPALLLSTPVKTLILVDFCAIMSVDEKPSRLFCGGK